MSRRETPWNDNKEIALNIMKQKLIQAPMRTLVNFSRKLHMFTDASENGFSVMLLQESKCGKHMEIVSFYNRNMSKVDSWPDKSPYQKELFAFTAGSKKFKFLLSGYQDADLHIDNKAVTQSGNSRSFQIRNIFDTLKVDMPNCKLVHVKSKNNISDLLSRAKKAPLQSGRDSRFFLKIPMLNNLNDSSESARSKRSAKRNQTRDTIADIEENDTNGFSEKQKSDAKTEMLNRLWMFHVRGGHPEAERVFQLFRKIYGSKHVSKISLQEVKDKFSLCKCFTQRTDRSKNFVPVFPSPNKQLFLDFKEVGTERCPVAGKQKGNGNKMYRLTVYEPLSGAVWTFPVKLRTGQQLIAIFRIILQVHGKVDAVRPDNAPEFVAGDFAVWCKNHGIQILPVATYNPCSNLAERPHSQINKAINLLESNTKNIEEDLFNFAMSHNVLPKRATGGYSPLEILKGGFLPKECIDGFSVEAPSHSKKTAKQVFDEVWATRNEKNLLKTPPIAPKLKFDLGQKIIFIKPDTVVKQNGKVLQINDTTALVQFSTGNNRIAWCSLAHLNRDNSDSFHKLL